MRRALALLALLTAISCAGAASQAADFCPPKNGKKPQFVVLPTVKGGFIPAGKPKTRSNADKYCKACGFRNAGTIAAIDSPCGKGKLSVIGVIECVPSGGKRFARDKNGNIGTGNTGKNNIGYNNHGTGNIGSNNWGSFNVGDDNWGTWQIGASQYGTWQCGNGQYGTWQDGSNNYGTDQQGDSNYGTNNEGYDNQGTGHTGAGGRGTGPGGIGCLPGDKCKNGKCGRCAKARTIVG